VVEFFVSLHGITIAIYNSPEQDEEDKEHTDRYDGSHVKHLVKLVSNENTKYSEEEDSNDPGPDKDGIHIHLRTLAGVTCVE